MLWLLSGHWGIRFVPMPRFLPANDRSENEANYYRKLHAQDFCIEEVPPFYEESER